MLFWILPRRIISKIRLKMPNHQKIFIKHAISFWIMNKKAILPWHDCAQSLANTFVNCFDDKIELIRNNLEIPLHSSTDQVPDSVSIFCGVSFEQFNAVSEADIQQIISSPPTKSCVLDLIPTWLLKQCQDQLTPVLTTIVNTSLSCAEFPTELKKAFLTPLIEKIILDCEMFKNYRPVSNLSFISKLVKRVVCVQLVEHLKANNLYEIFQSAYRQRHSTKTAPLRVQNDQLQAVDNEGGVILVLLDLSAAFGTIDHQKLLNLLNQSFGITGVALKWFGSHLKDRTQTVQNRIVYICTCFIKIWGIWGTSGFCTRPYLIYYVHNPSWEYYSKTWVELSSLRKRYSVVYFLPTRCISIKGDRNILSRSVHQGYKDMDNQQPFETEWWQNRTDRDHHSKQHQSEPTYRHKHRRLSLHPAVSHQGIWEFYLTRHVVSMTMFLKFAKASIITCIPLGKFRNILIPQLLRKWWTVL